MRLLVKIIGEFNDGSSEGLVTDECRWISQHESFGTCYVSPKTDTIGYNVGLSKLFWTNESMKRWYNKEKYVLIIVDMTYEKNGDFLSKSGKIRHIIVETGDILEELLK